MLHEILLSLSGIQSPIWDQARTLQSAEGANLNHYVSPPERAMLESLGHLQQLHVQIREMAAKITLTHRSMVYRALGASISELHLSRFMNKIIEVEALILKNDTAYVGGHGIVPLSTLVAEFAPWTRRLEWILSIVKHLDRGLHNDAKSYSSNSATVLDLLQQEIYTGYADIEDMATELLSVGQRAWMRATTIWVLYGKLPTSGAEDFCIKPNPDPISTMDNFMVDQSLLPKFVTPRGADALLSIGSALDQLRAQTLSSAVAMNGADDPQGSLLPKHLVLLESLHYPLNPSLLESVLTAINQSISANALSRILPVSVVMQLLRVILHYVLLDHGEFAVALISHADERVTNRQSTEVTNRPVRKLGRLDNLAVKEIELNGIIGKSLAELAALRGEEEVDDDVFDLAKELLSLKMCDTRNDPNLVSTLLPSPALLHLSLPPSSPLHIFISSQDIETYSRVNAYLLAIHRAGIHLSALWKISTQRRCHPTPLGPPRSASEFGKAALAARRARDNWRNRRTRRHWTSASKAMFMMNELKGYLQGEVIQSSWRRFRKWINGGDRGLTSSAGSSRPGTSSSLPQVNPIDLMSSTGTDSNKTALASDPRALAEAHQAYLVALKVALFLTNTQFIQTLKELLAQIDHFVALFSRLQTVWEGLDLQEDEGVMDAFSNHTQDEQEVLEEMDRTSAGIEATLVDVVDKVRQVETDSKGGSNITSALENLSVVELNGKKFVPWRARTIDRLVMKLDSLTGRQEEEKDGSGLVSGYEDE